MTVASYPPLPRDVYLPTVQEAARNLLGKLLLHRQEDGQLAGGYITETEAYDGEQDQACHARRGRTLRVMPMYDEAGHAFVYLTYGMHWLLNAVTGEIGYPAAVLIRAIQPCIGLQYIAARRAPQPTALWCNGPGKLTRALAIDGSHNLADLCDPASPLWISNGVNIPAEEIHSALRIGIDYAGEPWISKPWRFFIDPGTLVAAMPVDPSSG